MSHGGVRILATGIQKERQLETTYEEYTWRFGRKDLREVGNMIRRGGATLDSFSSFSLIVDANAYSTLRYGKVVWNGTQSGYFSGFVLEV
jgi:hypothetical protein